MGTKSAPLQAGERMWLRKSTVSGHRGGWCWVLAPLVPEGMDPALYQTRGVRILVDDGSGRPMAEQLPEARTAVRIWTVNRGQLVAGGTATQMRESHQAYMAHQAELELEQLQASRRAAAEASAAQDVTRTAMDAAELAWQKDPAAWTDYHKARAAHDAAWRRSNELAMRLPIVHVLDEAGGYRHLTEAEAAHQHWLDEQARTAAALEATHGTQV